MTYPHGRGSRRRRKQKSKRVDNSASGTTTTIYAAGGSYEFIDRNGAISRKHYIGDFAVVTDAVTGGGASTQTTAYLHRDHLGSVDTITDGNGVITQVMSFDAPLSARLRQDGQTPRNHMRSSSEAVA